MTAFEVLSWIIAGATGSWFAASLLGAGKLGATADWMAGAAGGVLGALTMTFVTGKSPGELEWWFSVPAAFIGSAVITSLLRLVPSRRPSP